MRSNSYRQRGASPFVAIMAFVVLGVVFLGLFFLSTSGGKKADNTTASDTATTDTTTSNEPAYIRIPENSKIYNNETYKFLFAYPDSFGELSTTDTNSNTTNGVLFQTQSALAAQKPIGDGTAFMNGRLAVYVYTKQDFKMVVNANDVSVAPTTTGNDTTWKVVSRGSSSQDVSIGDSYAIKTIKSQTGITVFDFTYRPSTTLALGRWVFAAGDNYVMVTLPAVSKPSGDALTDSNASAYDIIGSNIAKTVRVPATKASTDSTSSSTSSTGSTSDN
jgi:hypothetical protein